MLSFKEMCAVSGVVNALANMCQFYCDKTFAVVDDTGALYDSESKLTLHLSGGYTSLFLQYGEKEVVLVDPDHIFELGSMLAQEMDKANPSYDRVFYRATLLS